MLRKALAMLVALATIALLPPAVFAAKAQAQPSSPNIVVFYLDDVSPHDGRLWENPALTPNVYDTFVEHGIEFTEAIAETPMCCPGRAGLLTGLHTHNNGVLINDGRLFRPEMQVGRALHDAGYATMWVGKYLNYANTFTSTDWSRNGAGWTYLDGINARNGVFYDYSVHTKSGSVSYPHTHSTQMTTDRTIAHIRATPASQPVFAVMSVFNMHGANVPLPQFRSDSRCNGMPPWNPPNYNEADVSDKPPSIRQLPLLKYANGWPMVKYCREMLGIDWMVGAVMDELRADGRLDNTLLVMTADNGMTWGSHRLGQNKGVPYATEVPLYFSFPARWGDAPRRVDDVVSNIDLAPTFCAIAGHGCHLGPYPGGQSAPDGISMLPLLDAPTTATLGRDALLESGWSGSISTVEDPVRPGWHALRTTASNPLGRWHYVEWDDGFRELYNLVGDPWELDNQAGKSAVRAVETQLATRLAQLWNEGRTAGSYSSRPDAMIAVNSVGVYKGSMIYGTVPKWTQTYRLGNVAATSTSRFWVDILNRSSANALFKVSGKSSCSPTMSPSYFRDGNDVTAQVNAGTLSQWLAPGVHATVVIRVSAVNAIAGQKCTAVVTATAGSDPSQVDVVRAIVVR